MAGVVAIVSAQQVGGDAGALLSTLPALSTSVWTPTSRLGFSNQIIGADSSAIYTRSSTDFGSNNQGDVTRIQTTDGAETIVAGFSSVIGGPLGVIYLALPVGELDVILFGRNAISRIQGDEELWRVTITGVSGWVMADAAAVASGVVTVVYQSADFAAFRPINYRAFTFSIDNPPVSTDMSTWSL